MPAPRTTQVDPGSTRAVRSAAPRPVDSPHAKQRGALERRLRIDLRQRDLRHHRVLRERRGAHEVAQRLAVAREARRAVRQVAAVLLLADRQAEVRLRAAAVDAFAALRREQRDDVVARRHERHVRADALDHARALVSEHARRVAGGIRAAGGVEIGVADTARDESHEHLPHPGIGELHLLHDERLAELLEHRGTHPHGPTVTAFACKAAASVSLRRR
jgi:hypothetical protein